MIKKLVLDSSGLTVYSLADIARISGRQADKNLIANVNYYVKQGDLIRLSKGLYSVNDKYSNEELGNKLRSPSYVSLYTVLQAEGVVFQVYDDIFLVSQRSEIRKIRGQRFIYRKVKDSVLLNPLGLSRVGGAVKANKERAVLDLVYLDGGQHLDNTSVLDWDFMEKLNAKVYQSKTMGKYIKEMRDDVRSKSA